MTRLTSIPAFVGKIMLHNIDVQKAVRAGDCNCIIRAPISENDNTK